ncbi:MAG: acetate/propionate family kinase, partial [Rhodobacteraceae bacterium]|nr:acetate/propionate family kinase [Paracoccaceae bacterium]
MSGVTNGGAILTLNIGSSSIKFALYPPDEARAEARGQIERIGIAPRLQAEGADGTVSEEAPGGAEAGQEALTAWLLGRLETLAPGCKVAAVAHRVVHGGQDFAAPVAVSEAVLSRLEALSPLAPGHQPFNLAGIRAARERWPGVAQVAAFDTAFHRSQSRIAQLYAIPRALSDDGVLRYGFHGLSYQHVAGVLSAHMGTRTARGRVVVAHLGSGASLCAMQDGRSVATTMGFTALDGLMMGTRCGEIDPGVVLHLIRARGMDPAAVEELLSRRSGLLGVSGLSADMRDLLESDAAEAAEA